MSVKTMQAVAPGLANSRSGGEFTGLAITLAMAASTSAMGGAFFETMTLPRIPGGKVKLISPLP